MPGETITGLNASGVQPIEVQAAQLAAARALLDASSVRVLASVRQSREGVVAVLAAHTADGTLADDSACLALHLAGVARGDVDHVVLAVPGFPGPERSSVYGGGRTWGEFSSAIVLPRTQEPPRLLVYGHGRLLETVRLDLKPGERRVLG